MVRNCRKVHHIVRDATNLALSKSLRRFRTLESQIVAVTGVNMMISRWCGFWNHATLKKGTKIMPAVRNIQGQTSHAKCVRTGCPKSKRKTTV